MVKKSDVGVSQSIKPVEQQFLFCKDTTLGKKVFIFLVYEKRIFY